MSEILATEACSGEIRVSIVERGTSIYHPFVSLVFRQSVKTWRQEIVEMRAIRLQVLGCGEDHQFNIVRLVEPGICILVHCFMKTAQIIKSGE